MKRFTLILVFAIVADVAAIHLNTASAQEILLEGPLAGAPAVRKLVQYRKLRFGIAPYFNYTLNNEYVHNFLVGAHLEFNITDWFGIGINAAYAFNDLNGDGKGTYTKLTNHISESVDIGGEPTTPGESNWPSYTGADHFKSQVALMKGQYVAQLNFTPFRGKVAFFQRLFTAVDLSLFVGAGIVMFEERAFCGGSNTACVRNADAERETHVSPAPTAGLSFNFYGNDWLAVNLELRFTPFSWNAGGTDESGQSAPQWVLNTPTDEPWEWVYTSSGQEGDYPDRVIDENDRQWIANASVGLGVAFYFPVKTRIAD